jgi:hypothetical protein
VITRDVSVACVMIGTLSAPTDRRHATQFAPQRTDAALPRASRVWEYFSVAVCECCAECATVQVQNLSLLSFGLVSWGQ